MTTYDTYIAISFMELIVPRRDTKLMYATNHIFFCLLIVLSPSITSVHVTLMLAFCVCALAWNMHQCPGKYRICFIFSTSHASSSKYHCHSCTWSKLQDPFYLSRAYGRGIQCCHLSITILNSLPQRLWLNYDLGTVRGIQTSIIQFLIWLVFSDFFIRANNV